MHKQLILGALVAGLWTQGASAEVVALTDLAQWTRAGDVRIDSSTSASLTTAAFASGEQPLSGSDALLFDELELALSLAPGTTPYDTVEGSGLQFSFHALVATTISFSWSLSTAQFDPEAIDRAFFVVDGGAFQSLAEVAATTVSGLFSHTFGAGTHSLAFGIMDVNYSDYVSTLAVSDLRIATGANEVPEPGSLALVLAGVAGLAGIARRRRG